MARPLIGRTVRRLRQEQRLTQQALAARLGISASYLNLIEHDQRGGHRQPADQARRDAARSTSPRSPAASRAAARGATARSVRRPAARRRGGAGRRDRRPGRRQPGRRPRGAGAVPRLAGGARGGRRHRAALRPAHPAAHRGGARLSSTTAPTISPPWKPPPRRWPPSLPRAPAETNHAIAERLRQRHGADRHGRPARRRAAPLRSGDPHACCCRSMLPRESRGFHLAFQLALLEAREAVEGADRRHRAELAGGGGADPHRPAELPRRRAADALRAVRRRRARRCATTSRRWRRASASASSRPASGCPSLQRPGARGVPFFFLRVDPAGNVSKRFSAAGFPFARFGGSCPRWVVARRVCHPRRGARAGGATAGRRDLPLLRPRHDRAAPRAGASRRRCTSSRWAATSRHAARDGLCRRPRPGAGGGRHRPLLPAVRPAGLPQPRLPAAGAPAGARPADHRAPAPTGSRLGAVQYPDLRVHETWRTAAER